ncbi:MAG: hypothetical protein E7361_01170 [Clostridiales bacterium]|nr:hypothetical protein [Clostridiales bacterium]
MFEKIGHILLHSLEEALIIFPMLFLIYILIEVIENKCAKKWKTKSFLDNKYSPVIASAVGIIPQCGFSVVATDLYSEKKINIGTLLAIFIATSDEALPILIGGNYNAFLHIFDGNFANNPLKYVILLVIIKFVYAVIIGYTVNFIYNRIKRRKGIFIDGGALTNSAVPHHDHDYGCCGHDVVEEESSFKHFILHPLVHSLKICLYIFIVSAILSGIIEWVGLESISSMNSSLFQPLLVALIGLIPNCASSLVITNLFLGGAISFASCIAGLCANAGVALLVLFKNNKNIKENLMILTTLYGTSAILGFVLQLVM